MLVELDVCCCCCCCITLTLARAAAAVDAGTVWNMTWPSAVAVAANTVGICWMVLARPAGAMGAATAAGVGVIDVVVNDGGFFSLLLGAGLEVEFAEGACVTVAPPAVWFKGKNWKNGGGGGGAAPELFVFEEVVARFSLVLA